MAQCPLCRLTDFCPPCSNPKVHKCIVAFEQMSKERVQLEEALNLANAEMGQSRGHAQMLQLHLAAEEEDHKRQQAHLEQIAENALLARVNQIEARAENDRVALSLSLIHI
eukprot:2063067-Prorocentrum_lima.AAC.1